MQKKNVSIISGQCVVNFIFLLIIFFSSNFNTYSQVTINMQRQGGVSIVPCKVNGLTLNFIFDSGASDVTISLTEAQFMLKNGYLSINDIIGTQRYSTANGDITEGIKINLKEIEFGGFKLRNIEASIIKSSNAPLLLGQSVLNKLGDLTVNFEKNTLVINPSKTVKSGSSKYSETVSSTFSNDTVKKIFKTNPSFYKSCDTKYLQNLVLELLTNNVRARENESDFVYSIENNYLIQSLRYGNFNGGYVNIAEGIDLKYLAVSRIQSLSETTFIIELNVYGNNHMKNYTYEDYGKKLKPNGLLSQKDCNDCSTKYIYTGINIEVNSKTWDKTLSQIFSNCLAELAKRTGNNFKINKAILN